MKNTMHKPRTLKPLQMILVKLFWWILTRSVQIRAVACKENIQKLRLSSRGKIIPYYKGRIVKIESLMVHMEPPSTIFRVMFQRRPLQGDLPKGIPHVTARRILF